jgi:hypothetical protein
LANIALRYCRINILVLNPGGNSLKIDVIAYGQDQRYAFEATKLLSAGSKVGKETKLSRFKEKKCVHSEPIEAEDYASATEGPELLLEPCRTIAPVIQNNRRNYQQSHYSNNRN